MIFGKLKQLLADYEVTGEFDINDLPVKLAQDDVDGQLRLQDLTEDHLFLARDTEGNYYFGIEGFQEEQV